MKDRPQPGEAWQNLKLNGTGVEQDRKGGLVQVAGNAKMLADSDSSVGFPGHTVCTSVEGMAGCVVMTGCREETWRRRAWMMAQNSDKRWTDTQKVSMISSTSRT